MCAKVLKKRDNATPRTQAIEIFGGNGAGIGEKCLSSRCSNTMKASTDIQQLNVGEILRNRLPRYWRYIPRAVVKWLEKVICQEEMNSMLKANAGKRGADFCRGVLDHLDIKYEVKGADKLEGSNGRVLFVCNHPLGGLDGMILIDWLTSVYGKGVKFVVNDLLMAIEPLGDVFLPVNKHGKQNRAATSLLDEAMAGDDPVIMFPAGLVSRKGKDGKVADLAWNKMFVQKAIQNQRDIIPLYFSGNNSSFFYNFAKLRVALGLKFNIEMVRLPKEVFLSAGKQFSITVGSRIAWQSLTGGRNANTEAQHIKSIVYNLQANSSQ